LGGPGGGGALAPGAGGAPGALGGPGGGGALAPGAGGAPGALGGPGGGGPPPPGGGGGGGGMLSCYLLDEPSKQGRGSTNFSGLMNRLKIHRSLMPSKIAKRPSANKSLICWSC
jgi:hypothetical protein